MLLQMDLRVLGVPSENVSTERITDMNNSSQSRDQIPEVINQERIHGARLFFGLDSIIGLIKALLILTSY